MSSGPHTGRLVKVSDDRTIPTTYQGKLPPNYYCRGWNGKREKYCRNRAGRGTAHPGVGRCKSHGGQKGGGDARVTHGLESNVRSQRVQELIQKHLADQNPLDVSVTLATAKALMDDFIERYYEIVPALLAWHASVEPITEEQRLALLHALDELEETYDGEPTPKQASDLATARSAVDRLAEALPDKPRQVLDISDAVRHADIISKIIHRVNMHNAQSAVSYARLSSFLFALRNELEALIPDPALLAKVNERILQIRI